MACCFLFCSDEPVDNDKYGAHPNFFQIKLKDAPCRDPGCCMPACILWPCALYKTRTLVLVRLALLYVVPVWVNELATHPSAARG